jgi:hypothetical protein
MATELDIQKMTTPEQLKEAATEYNWDDGFEFPTTISNHPKCDLSVALSLFWLSEAIVLLTGEVTPNEYNTNWVDFCNLITGRILEGEYKATKSTFSVPLSKTQIYKYRKQGIPDVLLCSIN